MADTRREFVRKSLLLAGVASLNDLSPLKENLSPTPDGDRLVLLGTQGGPFIRSYKQTPAANLLVYRDTPYIIDTGYGITFKLKEAGINLSTLKYIFITHHHSDHNMELGPLLHNAWLSGLKDTIHVYGPAGLTSLLSHYWESVRIDIDTRIRDEGRPDIRNLVVGHEIAEGTLMSGQDVEVSAMKNFHPPMNNSYAYRFKLGGKVVVFSGDTAYLPALAEFARGAQYLVHEVMYIPAVDEMMKRRPNATKLRDSILSHHTSTDDVGKIATDAKAKNLVLNHFVPPDDQSLTEQFWIDAVKKNYSGNIIVGKDLLSLPL